ncbi:hypothetical protein P9126_04520 [Bacillus glycinifermentans]|uniref:hypothetical protein n=1 Tax=Bacillus TaxID=1386 RepID=UPI002DBF98F8|nr:hypothetical protein [Bacillus glycinifermentans]MEC3606263.1 hypothetical protein [Bacillus glycinifermentans]
MDNAEKELKRLKDGIEIALNNLQTEIKKEVDDVLLSERSPTKDTSNFTKNIISYHSMLTKTAGSYKPYLSQSGK